MTAVSHFTECFREATAGQRQEDIADRLGVDQTTVSRLLRGRQHRIGPKVARALVREYPALRESVEEAVKEMVLVGV